MTSAYWVFTFPSTYHALKAEKVLGEKGIKVPLAPIPRELTSNCGEVIRVSVSEKAHIEEILLASGVLIEGSHYIEPREGKGLLEKFFGF